MRHTIKKLSDKALSVVLREHEAGACRPDVPYTKCYHHAKMSCHNDCAGVYYCTQIGTC